VENIAYSLENVPLEDIINALRKSNIYQFIEQLSQDYETKVEMKDSFLSDSEKQRIAIAGVLLRWLKVLLFDEATSAMDSHNEQVCLFSYLSIKTSSSLINFRLYKRLLKKAQREDPSRTLLMIAHRLSTIPSCDLICVLDRGHIVESGTQTELIQQRGAYYRMLAQNNLQ
ncbi:unnamed protein product, partial [Rotaria sordida]